MENQLTMRIINDQFRLDYLNKTASQMTQGNGVLAIRGVHPENYANQERGQFLNGIYNKGVGSETSELVNLPDTTEIRLKVDGQLFSIGEQSIKNFECYLDMETGEWVRSIVFCTSDNKTIHYKVKRLISQTENIIVQRIEIQSLSDSVLVEIETGINGQMTNGGVQHILEEDIQLIGEDSLIARYKTSQSQQTLDYQLRFNQIGKFQVKNRQIIAQFKKNVNIEECYVLEKYVSVSSEFGIVESFPKNNDYQTYYSLSQNYWSEFWRKNRVIIESDSVAQFAIDFSLYHLVAMTPKNDARLSVGAKGLTGEGYKGHVFWDTEIFILPFFLYTAPKIARNLLEYRFQRLEGARQKASSRGYQGALFPWESAYSGQEETPEYAALNIRTGKRQKVASGDAEHHIVADIAFAIEDYYQGTNDTTFMGQIGKKLIEETARFWLSRTTSTARGLEILQVIGPDEYTEYIDNNTYTNYMAYYNVSLVLKYQIGDETFQSDCEGFLKELYLPVEDETLLLPQDDSFLSKPSINLDKYKMVQGSQAILYDYSRSEINDMQILKQADLIMLFYLFPSLFSKEVRKRNFYYYEERTIHDSSLSKAVHAIEALRLGNEQIAYQFFLEATQIDLGSNPHSSDDGLHAAALASLWHIVVFGFAGIIREEVLQMNPQLPNQWQSLQFHFTWKGKDMIIKIDHRVLIISSPSVEPIDIVIRGVKYRLTDYLTVELGEYV